MRKMLTFNELNEYTKGVFESLANDEATAEDNYNGFKKLQFDLREGNEIYDKNGNKLSRKEANKELLKVVWAIMGLDETTSQSHRARKRALADHKNEFFAVIEEEIDIKTETGFQENEFFNDYVEMRNIARGDRYEFWSDNDVILSVVKVAGDHHDFTLQRLGSGQAYTVATSVYGIAVGADIDMYLAGRLDWTKFTDQCAAAFVRKVQEDIFAEMANAAKKLPAQFKGTGAFSTAVKDKVDEILENVSIINGGVPVTIMGTRTALQQFNKLIDVQWLTNDQKDSVAHTFRLGYYGPYVLFEIPQRFALNDLTKKLFDAKALYFMPQVADKFIKFVDVGETEIYEQNQIGDRMDDTMKYEVQRAMGVGTQLGNYFGHWSLA